MQKPEQPRRFLYAYAPIVKYGRNFAARAHIDSRKEEQKAAQTLIASGVESRSVAVVVAFCNARK